MINSLHQKMVAVGNLYGGGVTFYALLGSDYQGYSHGANLSNSCSEPLGSERAA